MVTDDPYLLAAQLLKTSPVSMVVVADDDDGSYLRGRECIGIPNMCTVMGARSMSHSNGKSQHIATPCEREFTALAGAG